MWNLDQFFTTDIRESSRRFRSIVSARRFRRGVCQGLFIAFGEGFDETSVIIDYCEDLSQDRPYVLAFWQGYGVPGFASNGGPVWFR